MSMSANEFLTVDEAATFLRVSVSTIRRWIREGGLPAHRVGKRRILLKRADLAHAMRAIAPDRAPANKTSPDSPMSQPADPESTSSAGTPTSRARQGVDEIGDERSRQARARLGLPPAGEALDRGPLADRIVRSPDRVRDRRLTADEVDYALAAIEQARELREQVLASRGGKLFSPSWILINEARDERSRRLDPEEPDADWDHS